jgi:hypothetical protein
MAVNLPSSTANVTESGSLNLPEPSEPSGPLRPVMGLLYFYADGYINYCCHMMGDTVQSETSVLAFQRSLLY